VFAEPVQAIVFDFGGVFTRTAVSETALQAYDRQLGLPVGTLRAALHSGEPWELASTGRITRDEYWAKIGGPAYAERLPDEFKRYRLGVFHVEPIEPAMVQLAHRLHGVYKLALCSNALHDLLEVLADRPDVRELFDVVVASVQVGVRKPDPAIFTLTAERLGLPISACLLVDDKPRNTAAAEAIGMPAIVFESAAQLARVLEEQGLLQGAGGGFRRQGSGVSDQPSPIRNPKSPIPDHPYALTNCRPISAQSNCRTQSRISCCAPDQSIARACARA